VVNGRVPVIVGSGSNCTPPQVEKSIEYQNMGADALLLIAPYYNKANPEGMSATSPRRRTRSTSPASSTTSPAAPLLHPRLRVEKLSKHPNIAASRRPAAICPTP
jgi:4-hydroxy-tetrahydrodipicolinate synthase